jgi:predicted RecB family nuclease
MGLSLHADLAEENVMTIALQLLEAYLKCPTKCWLISNREPVTDSCYAQWLQAQNEAYLASGIHRLLAETNHQECMISPSADNLKASEWRLAANVLTREQRLESRVHAVERLPSEGRGKPVCYSPVRFVRNNRLGKDAKLLLAFDALALAEALGERVNLGKIIHGDDHTTVKVRISAFAGELQKRLEEMTALLSSPSPPDLSLIRHCSECQFQTRCRQKAVEKDDLSLLSALTVKERKKLHNKGIFTVTQLSYTFRPRRRTKRLRDKREKYHHALKALAIRENKIHIVGTPELRIEGTPVYLDVEGVPDRDFYYLIGVRCRNLNSAIQHSLWADKIEDEKRMWTEFLGILAKVQNPVLIHYGSYETTFLKRMSDRYGLPVVEPAAASAVKAPVNLLSVIFAQVYFPTLSNGLKDIGHFLGVKWNGPIKSGLQSVTCRLNWEQSPDPELKAALVAYNSEDCAALEILTSHLIQIIREAESRTDVEFSERPKKVATEQGAEIHRTLQSILRSAQFRYSRSRIKVFPAKGVQSLSLKKERFAKRRRRSSPSSTRGKFVRVPRRRICPRHPGHRLTMSSKRSQHLLVDLAFSKGGCRKTIIRYIGRMGYCVLCHESHSPPAIRLLKGQRFGWNFQAWVIYQRLVLRMSYRLISKAIYDLFSEPLSLETAAGFVERFSEYYQSTADLLMRRILDGPVVHLDETRINILGADQYVWVLTDGVRVAFWLRANRETAFLKSLFGSFGGIVISDFYGGYDALPCKQQKCLVHLTRDLNDDLWKNPFDDEFERFVLAVRNLLSPILEDVQRFGLKARHIGKHRNRVERFYRQEIAGRASVRETTARYRKRFERYKDSLFSFIEDDGVPWHNNVAERALRHLAVQRKISGAFGEKGAVQYLRLLGIAQTCRFQRKSFLGFLLSKSTDVDEYGERSRMHPDWAINCWEKG